MLASGIGRVLTNKWSTPVTGIYQDIQVFGLAVVLTTAMLETNFLESKKQEEAD